MHKAIKSLIIFSLSVTFLGIVNAEEVTTVFRDEANKPGDTQAKKKETSYLEIVNSAKSSRKEKVVSHAQLGSIYLFDKKYDKSLYHSLKSIELNRDKGFNTSVSAANYNLGMIYIHGKGRQSNNKKAFTYFSQAALKANNLAAMKEVFVMCIKKEAPIKKFREFENTLYNRFFLSDNPIKKEIATNGISLLYKCSSETEYIKKHFLGD